MLNSVAPAAVLACKELASEQVLVVIPVLEAKFRLQMLTVFCERKQRADSPMSMAM